MRTFISFCLVLLSSVAMGESTLPEGCQAIAVQGESVNIKTNKYKLVYIHNLAPTDLWITHPETNPGANAGWTTRLQTKNWSALAVDKGPFSLNCIESSPGHEQAIPCEGAIAVCQWKGVKFPKESQGTFWAAEDMSLPALSAAVGGRGFVLPAPK